MKYKFYTAFIFLLQSLLLIAQPPVRAHHALVYDETTKTVLMTTGSTPLDGGNSFKFFNDVWSYDGKKWILKGIAGDERSGIGLAYDTKRKKLYSFGGYTGGDGSRSEFGVFENNDWKTISENPGILAAEPGFVYDSYRDRLITFGGSAGRGKANGETWEWDGNKWKKFEGPGPEARQALVMVYDSKRNRTILFGGGGINGPGSIYGDTWEFDGSEWKKISDTGPAARVSAGYAYDSDKGLLILFGGMTKTGFVNDTWSYDGKEWKKLADTGPQARAMGYLAYDKERKKVVLFGGRLGWPNDTNDTWEWDGNKWNEIKF
jgi:hypothetical protein